MLERIRRATLGRFDVMTALGEGGMATVFLARDLALDRQVAIKVMNPALMSSPAALGRFRREARVAAALDHPHIISIFAVGEDAELAFYVMRYIEGRSIHDLLKEEGAQTFRRVESIISDVGQALHYAHRRGVIHRDVKPANIMLDHDDWLVVTDFGIAKLDEGDRLTLSGHVFGTPHYMSPEYFNGGLIGSASDQYALGVVAFELLTGGAPFPGETIGEVMRGHLFDPIPPLRQFRPDLPQAVEDCIMRMLSKEPALRFPTVADAVATLRAAGRSGESGVATEIIETSSRSPIVIAPPRRRRTPVWTSTWSGRMTFGIGVVATIGTIVVLGMSSIWSDRTLAMPLAGATEVTDVGTLGDAGPTDGTTGNPGGTTGNPGGATGNPGGTTGSPAPTANPDAPDERRGAMRDDRSAARDNSGTGSTSTPARPSAREAAPLAAPVAAISGEPGAVRIGSRLPLAMLYVGSQAPRNIGERGIQTVSVPPGRVRLQIRLDQCTTWDTTVTVQPGDTLTVGFRAPSC